MIFKRILLVIECFMALWFAAPFVSGIINAGNITGLLICAVLMSVTLFSNKLKMIISNLQQSIFGKILVTLIFVIIIVIFIYVTIVTACIVKAKMNKPKESMNIVVLGCKVNGDKPSKMLRMRLDAAEKYLSENEGALCVVSGGKGDDEGISEAEAMQNYLVEKGVDSNRIIIEDKSENTFQNIKYSCQKLEKSGAEKKFAIVTDGFHQYRAGLIAKGMGAETYSINAKIANPALIPTYYVREWLAVTREYLRKII